MKRRTEITIATSRALIIRSRAQRAARRCPLCARRVEMVSPEQAATITGLSERALFRLVEAGRLHFVETDDGLLRLCLNSLLGDAAIVAGCVSSPTVREGWD